MIRRRVLLPLLCALMGAASTPALAGDNEFHGVVRAIESQYGVHHMRIPLLGLAMFIVRPTGVSGMKLALFENLTAPGGNADLAQVVERSLGPGWYPFVRVRSHGDGETTLIYASPAGGKMRMMVVSIEPSEATIVEFRISDRAIQKWMHQPGEEAESIVDHHQSRAED